MSSDKIKPGVKQKLQALVLADSFTNTMRPVSLERPKVLFPLGNAPMLAYVLEFLEASGVEEAFVFCSSFADEVEAFLANSKYGSGIGDMVVRAVKHEECGTAGDALREVQSRELLKSEPFVLISGDVVSNIDLAAVIEAHKARHARDKECIMTMTFKQAPSTSRTRALGDDLVVALDGKDSRVLQYLDKPQASAVDFDVLCFKDHTSVRFRYDLLDCNVDVCSLAMVDRIADEYDTQDLRRDFVAREVADRELGLKIFGHVVTREYAARVFDPKTYDSITSDVIRRWAYPLAIDNNFMDFSLSTFTCTRGNRYKEDGVSLAPTAEVGPNTVVGAGTTLAAGARVLLSSVGRDCTLGKGSSVVGSHLWRGVTVEDGAHVDRAICCDGVVVRAGARVGRGCILSFGVVVDAGIVVPEFTRLTCVPRALVAQRIRLEEGFDDYSDDDDDDDDYDDAGGGGGRGGRGGGRGDDGTAAGSGAGSDFGDGSSTSASWRRMLATMTPENDPEFVGPNGVGRRWDPAEEANSDIDDDSDDEGYRRGSGKRRVRRAMVARSMGATEHARHVQRRWQAWGEDGGKVSIYAGGAVGGDGGWDDYSDDDTAGTTSGGRGTGSGGGGRGGGGGSGGGGAVGGPGGEAKAPGAAGSGGNGGGDGSGRQQQEPLGTDADFENTIHEWVEGYRLDDSQDMAMQIRMYALQVDLHLRPEAARIILTDVLEGDVPAETAASAGVKQVVLGLLAKWCSVLKSFVQDYSDAGVACLVAVEDFVVKHMPADGAAGSPLASAFPFVVMSLYSDLELLGFDGLQQWRNQREQEGDAGDARRAQLFQLPLLQRVLQSIQEQEEDSGSDSGSGSGSGSSESGSDSD